MVSFCLQKISSFANVTTEGNALGYDLMSKVDELGGRYDLHMLSYEYGVEVLKSRCKIFFRDGIIGRSNEYHIWLCKEDDFVTAFICGRGNRFFCTCCCSLFDCLSLVLVRSMSSVTAAGITLAPLAIA